MAEITCPRCKGSGSVNLDHGLGPMLRYARESADESLSMAATALGVSRAHVHALEAGSTDNPSFRTVTRIARHYGLSMDDLVKAVDETS